MYFYTQVRLVSRRNRAIGVNIYVCTDLVDGDDVRGGRGRLQDLGRSHLLHSSISLVPRNQGQQTTEYSPAKGDEVNLMLFSGCFLLRLTLKSRKKRRRTKNAKIEPTFEHQKTTAKGERKVDGERKIILGYFTVFYLHDGVFGANRWLEVDLTLATLPAFVSRRLKTKKRL